MLVKLFPDQVASNWQDIIKPAIRTALPPTSPDGADRMDKVLEALMVERMQCWFAYDDPETMVPIGVVTTVIQEDSCTDTKNLMIYSITSNGDVPESIWDSGFVTLARYAKSVGCDGITGYTQVASIVKLARRLGGRAEYVFIRVPLR